MDFPCAFCVFLGEMTQNGECSLLGWENRSQLPPCRAGSGYGTITHKGSDVREVKLFKKENVLNVLTIGVVLKKEETGRKGGNNVCNHASKTGCH